MSLFFDFFPKQNAQLIRRMLPRGRGALPKSLHSPLQGIKKALLLHPLSQGKHSSLPRETQAYRGERVEREKKFFFGKRLHGTKRWLPLPPRTEGFGCETGAEKKFKKLCKKVGANEKMLTFAAPIRRNGGGYTARLTQTKGRPAAPRRYTGRLPGGGGE